MNQIIERFSEAYFIINAETEDYGGEHVAMPNDLYDELNRYVQEPLLKIGNHHEWATGEWGIPPNTVAVPHSIDHSDEEVLMATNKTARGLVLAGGVDQP